MHDILAPAAAVPLTEYLLEDSGGLLTPALLLYADAVDHNIAVTIRVAGGVERWRPHVKTAKLAWTMQRLLDHGLQAFKCATTRELDLLCQLGAQDVLLAYPVVGANARRVAAVAAAAPATRVSVLVEDVAQLAQWQATPVSVFLDLNSGMDRTGLTATADQVIALARAVHDHGLTLRGLHWYDGQIAGVPAAQREAVAHAGYDRLMALVTALRVAGLPVDEVITSGTPATPHALSYRGFDTVLHRISPGTPVYGDLTSLAQLPAEWGYRPAALVLAAVCSRPLPTRITVDAGHKAVSADSGVPTCAVLGHSDWLPNKPSEEHLPIDLPSAAASPPLGTQLYLLPRHICPTVNAFDAAAIVVDGRILRLEDVTARGHEPGSVTP